MNETESLVLRARKYLNSAELLLNAGDYESSVSRSYYAMYFMVQSVLLHEGISASTHKGALSRFGDRFVKTGIFPKKPCSFGSQCSAAIMRFEFLSDKEVTQLEDAVRSAYDSREAREP